MIHRPVLQKEVLKYLDPKTNENFIDATLGEGGHAKLILEKNGPKGKLLGIDQDPKQIANSKWLIDNFGKRVMLVNNSYINLKKIVEEKKFRPVNGILLDLGMSSWQLEESGRGFSFLKDEPLDMRYGTERQMANGKWQNSLTAEEIVNKWPEEEIKKVLEEYGEEKFAKGITEQIIRERKTKPIRTTTQLIEIIKRAVPFKYQHGRIPRSRTFGSLRGRHCATRTFQALRIAVNDELNNLRKVSPQLIEILNSNGRLVIISFHSLEDRIVKNFLKDKTKEKIIKILTKKPITASPEEIKENPRARLAKLRAAIKITN